MWKKFQTKIRHSVPRQTCTHCGKLIKNNKFAWDPDAIPYHKKCYEKSPEKPYAYLL